MDRDNVIELFFQDSFHREKGGGPHQFSVSPRSVSRKKLFEKL